MLQPLHINPPHGVCLEQAVQMRKASVQYELDTLERLGIVSGICMICHWQR